MDFHLKQWTTHNEADEHQSAKLPKLLLDPQHLPETASSGLNLFLPRPHATALMTTGSGSSPFPDLASASTRFYRIGNYFSASQLQELELQALIFRYMVSGAPVPAELLQPIKKSLLHAPSYFLHYPHWSRRASMDPEPGRCRRTDGKKWRCSREVVGGQKYCERHVHRGRNRSRKPVEVSAPGSAASGERVDPVGGGSTCRIGSNSIVASQPLNTVAAGTRFTLSELSPAVDLFNLHASGYRSSGPEIEIKSLVESQNEIDENSGQSDGHVLRHFFDDWPRSLEETGNTMHGGNKNQIHSSTRLSISETGNSPSDISLKLSTGNAGDQRGIKDVSAECNQEEPPLSWSAAIPTGQMGGPLAEALQPSSVTSFVGA